MSRPERQRGGPAGLVGTLGGLALALALWAPLALDKAGRGQWLAAFMCVWAAVLCVSIGRAMGRGPDPPPD